MAQGSDSLLDCGQERVESGGEGGGYGRSVEPLGRADLAARVGDEEEGLQHRERWSAAERLLLPPRRVAAAAGKYC